MLCVINVSGANRDHGNMCVRTGQGEAQYSLILAGLQTRIDLPAVSR